MQLGQAVLGISQYVIPGLLALGYGEVERDGEPVRVLALVWQSGQRCRRPARRPRRPTPRSRPG